MARATPECRDNAASEIPGRCGPLEVARDEPGDRVLPNRAVRREIRVYGALHN